MTHQKRIERLEQQLKQTDSRHAIEWARDVAITLDDVRAIERRDWSQVNPVLRATRHPERWERAARALIDGLYGNA